MDRDRRPAVLDLQARAHFAPTGLTELRLLQQHCELVHKMTKLDGSPMTMNDWLELRCVWEDRGMREP